MAKKITVIVGSGFVGTNLGRQLSLKQQDFEIIDLKMSKQFSDKCKIADVHDADTLRKTITGDVIVNSLHPTRIEKFFIQNEIMGYFQN